MNSKRGGDRPRVALSEVLRSPSLSRPDDEHETGGEQLEVPQPTAHAKPR